MHEQTERRDLPKRQCKRPTNGTHESSRKRRKSDNNSDDDSGSDDEDESSDFVLASDVDGENSHDIMAIATIVSEANETPDFERISTKQKKSRFLELAASYTSAAEEAFDFGCSGGKFPLHHSEGLQSTQTAPGLTEEEEEARVTKLYDDLQKIPKPKRKPSHFNDLILHIAKTHWNGEINTLKFKIDLLTKIHAERFWKYWKDCCDLKDNKRGQYVPCIRSHLSNMRNNRKLKRDDEEVRSGTGSKSLELLYPHYVKMYPHGQQNFNHVQEFMRICPEFQEFNQAYRLANNNATITKDQIYSMIGRVNTKKKQRKLKVFDL